MRALRVRILDAGDGMSFASFFDYPGTAAAERTEDVVFLPELDEAGWARLLDHCQMCRFAAGETVVEAGSGERAIYIVADGTLESMPAGDDRAGGTVTIEPGAVIGAVAFFDGRPQTERIRSVTQSELFRLSFESFEVLAARDPALARTVLLDLGRMLAVRLRRPPGG